MPTRIPSTTVGRLSIYLRALKGLDKEKMTTVSSSQLSQKTGINPAQLRKDLAYFGQFGKKGKGYEIIPLLKKLQEILGVNRNWGVILVGVGNLGSALLAYPGFKKEGFRICAAFDDNLLKIGKRLEGVQIQDIERMDNFIRKNQIRLGIIAVPGSSAQDVADKLTANGIEAILNFSPTSISVPEKVRVINVDLTVCLENLAFYLTHSNELAS